MTTNHLSEQEIQQYALDKSRCDEKTIAHVKTCKDCAANVNAYLQLFSSISEQPVPVFDFNLSDLVLQQLPKTKSKFSLNIFFLYFLALAVLSAISIPVFIFRKYILSMFNGILPMTIYLIVITAITILVFQSIEMFRKYQKQMNALN